MYFLGTRNERTLRHVLKSLIVTKRITETQYSKCILTVDKNCIEVNIKQQL